MYQTQTLQYIFIHIYPQRVFQMLGKIKGGEMIEYLIALCENRYQRYQNLWLRLQIAYLEWEDRMREIREEVRIKIEQGESND